MRRLAYCPTARLPGPHWSFDQDGDTTLTELSGQRVQNGEFQFDRVIDAEGA